MAYYAWGHVQQLVTRFPPPPLLVAAAWGRTASQPFQAVDILFYHAVPPLLSVQMLATLARAAGCEPEIDVRWIFGAHSHTTVQRHLVALGLPHPWD